MTADTAGIIPRISPDHTLSISFNVQVSRNMAPAAFDPIDVAYIVRDDTFIVHSPVRLFVLRASFVSDYQCPGNARTCLLSDHPAIADSMLRRKRSRMDWRNRLVSFRVTPGITHVPSDGGTLSSSQRPQRPASSALARLPESRYRAQALPDGLARAKATLTGATSNRTRETRVAGASAHGRHDRAPLAQARDHAVSLRFVSHRDI